MRLSRAEAAAGLPAAAPAGPREAPFPRLLPWLLTIGGALGLLAAFVLAVEKIALLRNPDYVPSCSINPVLSCGSVMATPQAEVFGFPNPLLGIAGFAMVTAAGAALLAGARPRRWFWLGLQAGLTFAVVFVHWLIYQSLYVIGALCPYCMVVWAVTIPLFWYVTLRNLAGSRAARPFAEYHSVVLAVWFLAVIGLIGVRFWPYWSTLI
ncbi:vitamin K epoxide reductase family protein [Bailinhaonella thermotolerans]|uniref:Vitamin K epoxide reductase family protein n=1 Tax=Bailinhaonella thermotolerans TaxID=1070861 RepID=A0A3A4AVZ3_9ACTN|nr:vitamin K epoxide reductase family protein [Bailinhaonella thermotolerans]RJL30043.1 vitamin K epoxide reductase family protein [Bailinhaonella thermotolerans]